MRGKMNTNVFYRGKLGNTIVVSFSDVYKGHKMYETFKLFAKNNKESFGIYFKSSFREKKRNLL